MSYENLLTELLRPLGVYAFREGSFSRGELQALGAALDDAEDALGDNQKESIAATAENTGLARLEELFGSIPPSDTVQMRRRAITGFWNINGDSFTPQALERCIAACGLPCTLEETGVNQVTIRFPGVMGIPEGFARIREIVERILPCQLGIEYYFHWCTWEDTERYGLTWNQLSQMSWDDWRVYCE